MAWQLAGDSKHIDSELVNNVYELGTVRLFLVTETDRTIIMFETVCVYVPYVVAGANADHMPANNVIVEWNEVSRC